MSNDVMSNTTTIIYCLLVWPTIEGDPRMIRALIYVEFRLRDHVIKNFLEGAVDSRGRHETYVVSRVSPGPRLASLELSTVQLAILCDLACLGNVLSGTYGPLLTHM